MEVIVVDEDDVLEQEEETRRMNNDEDRCGGWRLLFERLSLQGDSQVVTGLLVRSCLAVVFFLAFELFEKCILHYCSPSRFPS